MSQKKDDPAREYFFKVLTDMPLYITCDPVPRTTVKDLYYAVSLEVALWEEEGPKSSKIPNHKEYLRCKRFMRKYDPYGLPQR